MLAEFGRGEKVRGFVKDETLVTDTRLVYDARSYV